MYSIAIETMLVGIVPFTIANIAVMDITAAIGTVGKSQRLPAFETNIRSAGNAKLSAPVTTHFSHRGENEGGIVLSGISLAPRFDA